MLCPCKSSKEYKDCCELAHKDIRAVKTAGQLMRSRYSAFTLANGDYLLKSWHSSARPSAREKKDIERWAKSVIWTDLQIINKVKGEESDNNGIVEFKAFYIENSKLNVIHERSNFVKEDGIWFYVDGKMN